MDVVVVGPASLQSTMLRLQHRQLPLRFTVYPMIHLAEQSFYDDVCDRLRGHQLIVAEGIHGQGRDRHARLLTLTYRLAGKAANSGWWSSRRRCSISASPSYIRTCRSPSLGSGGGRCAG